MFKAAAIKTIRATFVALSVAALAFLVGCAGRPVIETKVIEKPVPIFCQVETPAECKDSYAVSRVSPADDALTINRSLRAEIEERWACEIKLRAAVKGCNTTPAGKN